MKVEDEQEIIEQYLEGASIVKLAAAFKVARGTIYSIIDKAGVRQERCKPVDTELAKRAQQMLAKQHNPTAISVKLGVPAWWVRYVCGKRSPVPFTKPSI
jgi:transposase-like protein